MTCRCGHDDGSGQPHRCHADRHDDGKRCPNAATRRFLLDPIGSASLAGMQPKFTGSPYWYCGEHWAELDATRGTNDNR